MRSFITKAAALILCIGMGIALPSCSKGAQNEADETEAAAASTQAEARSGEGEDAPITSNWEYYSVTTDAGTFYESELGEDDVRPMFSTEDGETFLLSLTGERVYDGSITLLEDGTYELRHGDNENAVYAEISGDTLTITIVPGSSFVVFKTAD